MSVNSPNLESLVSPQAVPHDKPRGRMEDGKFVPTFDSFQNFLARVGVGTDNQGTAGRYGFNPVSRNRLLIEWAYRGSWVVGTIVDCVAEDMTREGVSVLCDEAPDDMEEFELSMEQLSVWPNLCDTVKWARLYGGALGLIMIDGQDVSTPLDINSISKGQFKGVFPLDRWAVFPSLLDLVKEQGPDLGNPRMYECRPDIGTGLPYMNIHYSRVIRMEGVRLPYWQRITENYWGQSVIERLWDRLIAFDSSTEGAAQLVYKAHLRTYKVDGLRKIIAMGGPALDGLLAQMSMIRRFQSNEGLTLMDALDDFQVHPYTFTGLDLILLQFGQQLSGASQIPLVRLFGQSPAGLNATGESDLRTYYDGIKRQQKSLLGVAIRKVYEIAWRSYFGVAPPKGWKIKFLPLWLLDDEEQSNVGKNTVSAIMEPFKEGVTARSTTLKELRQQSRITGLFTNITDEMINEAVKEDNETVPSPEDVAKQQQQQGEVSAASQHERDLELAQVKTEGHGNSTE
jgi:phage-related protein (TIGR01555 family)